MDMNKYYNDNSIYPDDITTSLLSLVPEHIKEQFDYNDIESTLYNLRAIAQNKYNNNGYRQLYNLLIQIAENNPGV